MGLGGALPMQLVEYGREYDGATTKIKPALESDLAESEKVLKIGKPITLDIEMPAVVKADKDAREKWEKVIGLYFDAGIEFVSTADLETLERYCIAYAEYYDLIKLRKKLLRGIKEPMEIAMILKKSNIDGRENTKCALINQLATKLYLDPASRIRHYAGLRKKEIEEEKKTKNMFGD